MFIIQEIQTEKGATALLPAITKADRNEAESVYHLTLGAAAISSVDVHTVMMYDEHGNVIKKDFYEHTSDG